MPSTSGYNLRLRRGAKVESRPSSKKRHNKEDQCDPEEAENNNTAEEQRRSGGRSTRSSRGWLTLTLAEVQIVFTSEL
ncbi:hypothetical protein TNCV_3481531 [Trichonephila clavipes]|nr:hypothetical protein TNCV_3481531 [Trichonephila clavipes]